MDAKTLCLGILTHREASGYEIRKAFEEGPFHHFFDVGYGSIYPALNRLAEEGLVSCRAESQEKRPDKKVYSITEEGRLAFTNSLMEPLTRDKLRSEFLFFLFFADLLPSRHVERVVDDRIAEIKAQVARMESNDCGKTGDPCRQFVHGYGLALYRAIATYMEENKHILIDQASRAELGAKETEPAVSAAE
ncbi:MAG: PadR family transcriptional regulator [Alphaproteobacteria bacterium]|nr:PadR family transcriptional regulator [Alphaproteobacteria bacterium]